MVSRELSGRAGRVRRLTVRSILIGCRRGFAVMEWVMEGWRGVVSWRREEFPVVWGIDGLYARV